MIEALEALESGDGLGEFLQIDERHGGLAERVKSRGPYKKKQFGSVDGNRIGRVATQFSRLGQQLHKVDDEVSRDLVDAVRPFALEAREELLRRAYVSFDGLLVLARDLLLRSTDVRNALKKRFRMLLVDEFQDTDPVQYEIVLLLAEKDGNKAGDPYRAALEPGRLFIVGDPKQSIYRFRGADFAAYRRAVERILECDGAQLNLVANFRSVPDVTEPVNRLFEAADGCWEPSRYQPDYAAIESSRERAGGLMVLDLVTQRNLELVTSIQEGRREGTLLSVLDRTCTSIGARALRQWLSTPLLHIPAIDARLDSVEELMEAPSMREGLRSALGHVGDLERLMARICCGRAMPRDLVGLRTSLEALSPVQEAQAGAASAPLARVRELPDVAGLVALVRDAIVDDPPATLSDGGIIRAGNSPGYDNTIHFLSPISLSACQPSASDQFTVNGER